MSFSVQAEETGRDKQKGGREEAGINKNKERRVGGEGGKAEVEGEGPDQARLFCEAVERRRRYMKSCFYPRCLAPLVIKVTGFIHGDIVAS